jgi:hypothetical protein
VVGRAPEVNVIPVRNCGNQQIEARRSKFRSRGAVDESAMAIRMDRIVQCVPALSLVQPFLAIASQVRAAPASPRWTAFARCGRAREARRLTCSAYDKLKSCAERLKERPFRRRWPPPCGPGLPTLPRPTALTLIVGRIRGVKKPKKLRISLTDTFSSAQLNGRSTYHRHAP